LFDPAGSRRKLLSIILEGFSIHRRSFDYFEGERIVQTVVEQQCDSPSCGRRIVRLFHFNPVITLPAGTDATSNEDFIDFAKI
jgi:hypothetical protein